ncbi:ankyrin repeat and LEM domain-containing protein 2-like [Aplochiton taeniatus]
MEEVLVKLQQLTPDQLRLEVIGAGLKCGPVTATTRAIFERKLARCLLEKDGVVPVEPDNGGGSSMEKSTRLPPDRVDCSPHPIQAKEKTCSDLRGESEQSPSGSESPNVYYGVCPFTDESIGENDKVHVFVDRKKTLLAMGTMKDARFKAFSTREEAEMFSRGILCSASPSKTTPDGPKMSSKKLTNDSETMSLETSLGNTEKANEFRSPRTQDLTAKLRKAVEKGDKRTFRQLVWDNPRFLIGSGDNPTIVHEGCHYNVLHVAAKENQPEMAQLLLDTLESPTFMRLMYPHDQEIMLYQRIRYIVDLYLNTPDRSRNETPLHFACKFGCPDVVNVLCSHPTTDKHCKNKYSQEPSSVICERDNKKPEIKKKIREYLEDRYYVPLLRDIDNSFQPVIGLPWSADPLKMDFDLRGSRSEGSPFEPQMTLKAYVGPLSPSKAKEFYKLWKTPPRDQAQYFHRILKSDPNRGVERVGREIAHSMGHTWAEYWDFLDSFVDLTTEEGLVRLEDYLQQKDIALTPHGTNNRTDTPTDGPGMSSTPSAEQSLGSPVCNLLPEFEKNTLQDSSCDDQGQTEITEDPQEPTGSVIGQEALYQANGAFWRTREMAHEEEKGELSSNCSEEYVTADEDSDFEGSADPRETRVGRRSSISSCSSYQSTEDTTEETIALPETPVITQGLFIVGESPTMLDREVLSAVEKVEIDPERFPCIAKWRDTILAYSSPQRLSWPSPLRRRTSLSNQEYTPSRLSSPSNMGHTGFLRPDYCSPTLGTYTQHILCRSLFRSPN